MPVLNLHPYQKFDLENLPGWRQFQFNNEGACSDEEAVNDIERGFQTALLERNLHRFANLYCARAREILARSRSNPLVHAILGEALARMVLYYLFLTKRGRSALATEGSAIRWQIDPALLQYARRVADEVVAAGESASRYYKLSEDKPLSDWVRANVRPVIESYVGSRATVPDAHIRAVDTKSFAHSWQHIYKEHAYGYFHWDELCYSMPLIVYLDDVSDSDGPYSYVEGTDKLPQNFAIRAFTQAISCKLLVTNDFDEAHKQKIASLPRIFRGGEMVGAHLDPAVFDERAIRRITGVAGTAVLSDGFSLVHAGGHPSAGRRRALFIAHRYPRKKLLDVCAAITRKWWSLRMPRP